ncbi:hypothetical protein ACFFQW_26045 [Umezawaea endophytica]|uniref:Uncharacterized protein n=1 Tax=Umezawaea endophytica TaxID=1654476 RepID=A0A9X2VLT2_9PSEU|nr:hypothetical protein [Umezawaea endophytica]MCS7479058.1 hypothetical protein [Umezawaea endophytica]
MSSVARRSERMPGVPGRMWPCCWRKQPACAAGGALDALATKLDGKSAAATVYSRKCVVLFNLLALAVEGELIPDNPLNRIKRKVAKLVAPVDPRAVANRRQIEELLTAVSYAGRRNADRGAHVKAFFTTCYYAVARPDEGLGLKLDDCTLPDKGWGLLIFSESRLSAGNDGRVLGRCTTNAVKYRSVKDVRPVPIPLVHVRRLRDHIDRFGVASNGRLFWSPNGGVVSSLTYY